MQNVGGVNVLQAAQDLVQEVADVVVTQLLVLQKLVEVRLHQALDYVHVLHRVQRWGSQDVPDVDDLERERTTKQQTFLVTQV